MKYDSKKKVQSKLPGFEDVSFTLKKLTEGRRIKLNLALADVSARLRELVAESETLVPTLPEGQERATLDPVTLARVRTLTEQTNLLIDSEVNPAWVRWGLDKIEGLEIDGEAATVETLISDGPAELYTEILTAIRKEAELSPEETKNS